MDNQLQRLFLMTITLLLIAPPAWSQQPKEEDTENRKTKELLTSSPQKPTALSQNPSQTLIQVTGVRLETTDKGIEVILETTQGDKLQPVNKSDDNNYIVDIPNAQLRLSSGDTFRQENPVKDITSVTVSNFDANTIRVMVTGEASTPQVELFDSDEGLIFTVAPIASTTQTPPTSETPPEPTAESQEPIELVVTGEQDGYRIPDASTATKTDTPIRDIPQSIQVIPREVLQDQGIIRVNDALQNVSGANNAGYYQGFSEYLSLRGFGADTYRDGIRSYQNYGGFLETADIERIEVLKGPASVLFGDAQPGGLVNLVSKQPLNQPFYSFEGTVGSFSTYRGAIDLSGPINQQQTVLYRFNAFYENAGSFRDFVNSDRLFFAPKLQLALSPNTTLTLDGVRLDETRTADDGLVAIGNRPANLPRDRFLGEPFQNVEIDVTNFSYLLNHKFNDQWSITNSFRAQFVNLARYYPLRDSLDEETGELSRLRYFSERKDNAYSTQTNVVGKFSTGSIKHQLLFGFEYTKITEDGTFGDFTPYPSINIFNPIYSRLEYPRQGIIDFFRNDNLDKYGFYFQDQIDLLTNLKLLAGGRFDIFEQTRSERNLGEEKQEFEQSDSNFSPRLGIVYQPTQNISLYASYTTSFEPTFATGRNGDGSPFKPETGRQFEVGVKADISSNLSATLALYDLRKQNVAADDPNSSDPNDQIQTGEQTSRGIEFDLAGEILPGWKVIGSYGYIDSFVSQDTTGLEGRRRDNVPKHTASLWTTYEFQKGSLQGFGLGLGVYFVGDRFGDLDNSYILPSYVRTDAALFYQRDNWKAAINLRNLFNTEYFLGSDGGRLQVQPGAPFSVSGTLSIEF
ncbi:TonB-dependent siderophore receptor [Nostoc sp. MG11]|uniref:TonB-dependent siderophore receptor n=1 Tax=Nostoc sp. MG11 TaxID=2721166 RepID=UPI00186684DA|nr:TonB-dependent siderophore receptor [Nostoc sp. MG11]